MSRYCLWCTIYAALCLGTVAFAQDSTKTPPKPSPLDQQLLEGLDRELLQGLPGGTKPAAQAGKAKAGERLPGEPPGEPAGDSQNPLIQIAQQMRLVEGRLSQQDTSPETQEIQQQILKELSALLDQARRQQGSGQNKPGGPGSGTQQAGTGGGNPAPAPPRDSTNRIEQGTKESVEATDVKDLLRRIWGHLPDKLRDQMQASLSEQFLPKYERLIEEYYKRLAEERPGGP